MQQRKNANKSQAQGKGGKEGEKKQGGKKQGGFFSLLERIYGVLRIIFFIVLFIFFLVYLRYGGNKLGAFPSRSTPPLFHESGLELVGVFEHPPGNIAVTKTGRIFITLHPEGHSATSRWKVAEVVAGSHQAGSSGGEPTATINNQTLSRLVAYPSEAFQGQLGTPLSIRLDRQNRLWVLDFAHHAVVSSAQLFGIDLETNQVIHHAVLGSDVAPFASMMNDFQVDPEGKRIFIADASFFGKRPALIVYDIKTKKAKRVLENHPSVTEKQYRMVVKSTEREMTFLGVVACRPGVDSIVLDRRGEYLYYASVSDSHLFRIHTKYLNQAFDDQTFTDEKLAQHVETFANKTVSDGLTIDSQDNIYITDPENSAIQVLYPNRTLQTLYQSDSLLRWPDGFSFGGVPGAPSNSQGVVDHVYVSCSSLHEVILKTSSHMRSKSPFHVFRFKALSSGIAGH